MEQLRVGVIGLGVGEQHLAAYEAEPRCRVAAICDASEQVLADVAGRHDRTRLTTDPRDVLTAGDIDLVSIASYDQDHFHQARLAMEAGKHVFVEKPLCRSAEELSALRGVWEGHQGRVRLASNLVLRAAPLYQWLRAAIRDGVLGTVYAFDGDYLYGRLHKITDGWRKDVADYSVMQGGGIHLVDLMLFLTGQRPERVSAASTNVATRGSAFRHADFTAATFEFPSGMIGRITANFGSVHRHQHVVRVFGTRGTFIYDDLGARLHGDRDPGSTPTALAQAALPASKGALIPAFVADVLDGGHTAAGTRHEFDVVSACLAADRAAASGSSEAVNYS